MVKLTSNAISIILAQRKGKNVGLVVEALNVKAKEECLKFQIKDDQSRIAKAVIWVDRPELNLLKVTPEINNQNRYFIKITEFQTHEQNGKVLIEIFNFEPLTYETSMKQPPITKTQSQSLKLQVQQLAKSTTKREIKVQERQVPKTMKKDNANKKAIEPIESLPGSENRGRFSFQNATREEEEVLQDVTDEQLRQFQKIDDLYIDFQGKWEIVVRVLEKSYREFTNRSGKLTKIFSMVLVDRTGRKIEGVMFGDNAKDYHEMINQNQIYRMSRGQVRQENYNQNKGKDFSRYNIIFSKNSTFISVREIKSIPRAQESEYTIEQVLSDRESDKVFNIVGILLEINEQRLIEKEGRSIFKKGLVIGNPQTRKSIEVVIWNKDLKIDARWIEKTVVLKNFKTHIYRDVASFSSIFKSEIVRKENHRFYKFEGKYSVSEYEPIEGGSNEVAQASQKAFRYISQIENQLNHADTPLISDLQVWLNHISFKGKWFYDACNNLKCKKAAEPFSKCIHCQNYNDNCNRRFILPIEIIDYTGSLWTTAFDQFAMEIFKGMNAQYLSKMSDGQVRELGQSLLYRQYKLKISSKRDPEGNIKHSIVGKSQQASIEKLAANNVEKIKKALG